MGNQASYDVNQDPENINLVGQNLTELPFIPLMEKEAKHLYLSNNKLATLPDNLEEVLSIDLSKNNMGPSLPTNVAKALTTYRNLRNLILASNHLKDLSKFLKNDVIETINLTANQFSRFPEKFKELFPKVKKFYFSCNFLKTFSNFQSELITILSLSLNCIESIDVSSLNMPQLTKLDLSKNKINKLPNNLSKSFPILNSLDLSDNFIDEIPENDDDNIVFPETLQELNLSNNLIEKISNSITSLNNLTVLTIANNKITEIPALNPSLTNFDASRNEISTISKQTLKNLKEISLSDNKITSFPIEIKMKQVTTIVLHHNQITEIKIGETPLKSFLSKTLKSIDLSFNEIEDIPKELFETLPNLQIFAISFNKISIVPPEISACTKMTYLELSSNPIKNLPKMPLSLETIAASNCLIESLDDVFIEQRQRSRYYSTAEKIRRSESDVEENRNDEGNRPLAKSESQIAFSGLRQADFSENLLEEFPNISDLQILNLSHNKLKTLPTISSQTRILDVSMNEIENLPDSITAPFLIELNLSFNKFSKLPKFQRVSHLKYLELAGNHIKGSLDVSEMKDIDVIDLSGTEISTVTSQNTITCEIITSNKNFKILNKKNKPSKLKSLYVDISCSGFTEMLGLRDSMEDSIILRDDLGLYAVSDGHGGSYTSRFISSKIISEFEKENELQSKKGKGKSKKEIITSIFKETKKSLKKKSFSDGSTICLCHIYSSKKSRNLITAHLGDARALIIQNDGCSRELTKDHKPFLRNEFERIHNIFGSISNENRVDGILAVSKTMGDNYVFGVGHDPEINEFVIDDEKDRFLVIACDGVFDVLSNDEVARIVMNCESPNEAAFKIRNVSFGVRSLDNITVIVVNLMNNNN